MERRRLAATGDTHCAQRRRRAPSCPGPPLQVGRLKSGAEATYPFAPAPLYSFYKFYKIYKSYKVFVWVAILAMTANLSEVVLIRR